MCLGRNTNGSGWEERYREIEKKDKNGGKAHRKTAQRGQSRFQSLRRRPQGTGCTPQHDAASAGIHPVYTLRKNHPAQLHRAHCIEATQRDVSPPK
jgi:hypothetical protein